MGKRFRIDVWIDVERNNFYKYLIIFHTDLINNFWSTKSNSAKFNREVAVIPADGACKITWETVENWRLNSRRNECLLQIFNQISH